MPRGPAERNEANLYPLGAKVPKETVGNSLRTAIARICIIDDQVDFQ